MPVFAHKVAVYLKAGGLGVDKQPVKIEYNSLLHVYLTV